MFLPPKIYTVTTLILYSIAFITMFRVGMIVFHVEMGNTTMNKSLRKELYDILWYLTAAFIPLFLYKSEEAETEDPTESSESVLKSLVKKQKSRG